MSSDGTFVQGRIVRAEIPADIVAAAAQALSYSSTSEPKNWSVCSCGGACAATITA